MTCRPSSCRLTGLAVAWAPPEQLAHLGDVRQQQGHSVVAPHTAAAEQIGDLLDAFGQFPVGSRVLGPEVTVGGQDTERRCGTEPFGAGDEQVVGAWRPVPFVQGDFLNCGDTSLGRQTAWLPATDWTKADSHASPGGLEAQAGSAVNGDDSRPPDAQPTHRACPATPSL